MTERRERARRAQETGGKVLPFGLGGGRQRRGPQSPDNASADREVVALVTVTRFFGNQKVHAQVPVFADEIYNRIATREELGHLIPDLSEHLADGAAEANAYLDRVAAARNARPIGDFYPSTGEPRGA